jgi:hypothetical protein
MKRNSNVFADAVSAGLCSLALFLSFGTVAGWGQAAAAPVAAPSSGAPGNLQYSTQGRPAGPGEPVSYASMTELNGMLAQLEATSKNAQADLVKLRIERWKADGATKKQSLTNVDSIQRNLQGALPEIIAQLRAAPEDVPATFKLYRNLDALYDVLGSVVESTGAFGSKDDLQALANDLNAFEGTRKQMAERIETLSAEKEAQIVRLRADLKAAQAIPATPAKKTVVDDNEPPKRPVVKKKPVAKPGTTAAGQGSTAAPAKPAAAKPAVGQTPTPAAQTPTPAAQTPAGQTPAKPQ